MPERNTMRIAVLIEHHVSRFPKFPGVTYGAMPRVATADGRERIPSEMFTAIITIHQ